MKLDVDLKERIKIFFLFMLQAYKVLMGSMLILFVPQKCDDHVCTFYDNVSDTQPFHLICFTFNSLSAVSFIACYLLELKRENWCVEYLDINKDFSDNNLKDILLKNPQLKKQIMIINNKYYNSARITLICYFINLILSTIYLYYKYLGLTTLTTYLSFVLLVVMKLYNAYLISADTKSNDRLLSSYMSEYQSFNVIDNDYADKYNKQDIITQVNQIVLEDGLRNRSPKGLNTVDLNLV